MFLFGSGRQEREEDEKRMSRWVYLMLSNSDLIWNKDSISSLSYLLKFLKDIHIDQRLPALRVSTQSQYPESVLSQCISQETRRIWKLCFITLPSSLLPGFYHLYFSKWLIFIQILELNILSAILPRFWSSKHMLGTILGSVYTMMKKTKVIPNFMEFFWWGRQIMNKETNTCTKL